MSRSYGSKSCYDNMRGFDPVSEDDMDDNGMSRYMENDDDEGWDSQSASGEKIKKGDASIGDHGVGSSDHFEMKIFPLANFVATQQMKY